MLRDFKIVAPSFATVTVWPLPVDCKMLPCSRQRKNQNKKSQVLQYPITSELPNILYSNNAQSCNTWKTVNVQKDRKVIFYVQNDFDKKI